MKILYSEEIFDASKNSDKLPLECFYCAKTFYRQKTYIKSEIKRGKNRIKYCSVKCANEGHKSPTKYTQISCTNCTKSVKKLTKDLKKSKSGNHFCSVSCSNTFNKTRRSKLCLLCTEPIATKSSKYCIDHKGYRPNDIKAKQRTDNHTLKYIKERVNYDSQRMHIQIRAHCRNRNKHLQTNPCSNCGYKLHVQLCHIKPVASFPDTATLGEINDPSNIATLCPNCHWEYDNGYLKL